MHSSIKLRSIGFLLFAGISVIALYGFQQGDPTEEATTEGGRPSPSFDDPAIVSARRMIEEGRHTFRFDTFHDEDFWGRALRLHEAIAGQKLGGGGPGVSPRTALAVGLKVDATALSRTTLFDLRRGAARSR